jgi:hypothetical protein
MGDTFMPALENKTLETPRSAVALGFAAIVLGVGSPMMPSSSFPFLIALFYLIALATAWLCRTEIGTLYARIRRSGVMTGIPTDFWFVLICVAVEVVIPTYLLVAKPSDEDLRVSFRIEGGEPNRLDVSYIFLNVGKQSALVNGVWLFEIVALSPKADPVRYIDLCDEIEPKILPIIEMGQRIMGVGAQVGGEGQRSSIYGPRDIRVDGIAWDLKNPVAVENGKTRIISASFDLLPEHWKNSDALVFCPMVGSLDLKYLGGTSICKGKSIGNQLTERLGATTILSNTSQQFRILPHSTNPTCPSP